MTFKIIIETEPVAKQSTKFTKTGHAYQPQKIAEYKKIVELLIKQQLPNNFVPFNEPVEATYSFIFPDKKRNGYKATRPDIDNLMKAINDVIEPMIITNDALICRATAEKRYCSKTQGKTIITISKCVNV